MQERKSTTKYFLPVAFAIILVVSMALGVRILSGHLMKLTIEERSNQLVEMVTQIQANLDCGLQTHWNLAAGLNNAVQGNHFMDNQDVSDNIAHMENDFCTDLYGCRVMLLDEQGTAYLSDGPAGIWYDISHLLDGKKRHTFVSETDTIDGNFLVFSQELASPITMGEDHVRFTHIVLLKNIQTMKQYYTTATYGGSAATYIIKKNGTLAYYDADDDDVIGARNIFKALEEAEYVQGRSFDVIKERLDRDGIVASNILLNQTEYYYCLTALDNYDMTLMLLIPADSVAVSTLNMMNSTVRTQTIFMSIMVILMLLAVISFVGGPASSKMVIYALTGLQKLVSGQITLCGTDITKASIRKRSKVGMSHIPEDRHKHGLVLDYSLEDNIVLQRDWEPEFQKNGFIKRSAIRGYAKHLINQYDVRSGQGPITAARSMSGGNQQKAIVAREIDKEHKLLVAVQPTRGLDVGAIEYIHEQLLSSRDSGKAVLLVSLELDEVMNISDRILVMYEGEIVGELNPKNTTVQELGLYMSGAKRDTSKGE